jgi:SCY1-like protein 1
MGNRVGLPYSIDSQIGVPHDHNGWALHNGKSTDGRETEVSVFVGKKPQLAKTATSPRFPHLMQLIPALHHFRQCKRLRHPHILKVYATLDTDNPTETTDGPPAAATSSKTETGDLMIVTEPCVSLNSWLLSNPSPEQLAWGLECLVRGLHFMHADAKLAHGNLSPSSFYVTKSGDVKVWNFSLVTQIGPNLGPGNHFKEWEQACTQDTYRGPERVERRWDAISNAGVHALDSYSLGILIDHWFQGRIPQQLNKAVQRLQTPNIRMRPRLQPLLKCPIFDTPYQKLQLTLEGLVVQPVEQKIALWQNVGTSIAGGLIPKDLSLFKILPLIQDAVTTICSNETMLSQDMYRREGKQYEGSHCGCSTSPQALFSS